MAGPWFTVERSEENWQLLDTIWISNGGDNAKARVELKVEFDEAGNVDRNDGDEP